MEVPMGGKNLNTVKALKKNGNDEDDDDIKVITSINPPKQGPGFSVSKKPGFSVSSVVKPNSKSVGNGTSFKYCTTCLVCVYQPE